MTRFLTLKKIQALLPLLLLAAGNNALAQPVLTAATNGLSTHTLVSDQFHYRNSYGSTMSGPGQAGANQLWDYSSFSPTYQTTNAFCPCPAAPYWSSFPGTNVVENDSLAFGSVPQKQYYYYKSTDSILALLGEHSSTSFVYSQPEIVLTFPFTYLSHVESHYSYPDPNVSGHFTVGVDSVLADGYGTLKTPAGTFNNVLRVKTVRTYYDSSGAGSVLNEKDYFYRWYLPQFHDYLFTLQDYEPFGGSGLITGYTSDQVVLLAVPVVTNIEASIQIVPNPASQQAHLRFTTPAAQQAQVVLTDMAGRTVYSAAPACKAGNNDIALDLVALPPGIYLLRLTAAGTGTVRKLIVE